MVSLIDALHSTYPAMHRLLGDEFFKASAKAYIEAHPPTQPVMAEYGDNFGHFVSALPTVSGLPYLSDVAELEWCNLQAYHSADAPVFNVAQLSSVPPDTIMDIGFICHPALHVIESRWPVGSIWMMSTSTSRTTDSSINMNQAEAILITRPELQVHVNIVSDAAAKFLRSIQKGDPLGIAAQNALEKDETFDAGSNLTGLIGLGAFRALTENSM